MDGMEDTHKLYRRKTSHAKLCENIKAFTDAGGSCHVYMTTFEHNKHQIEEVKELSRKLGAKAFKARGSFTGDRVMEVRGINEANNKFLPWDEANYTMKAWYPDDGQDRFTENDKQIDTTRAIFRENERPNSTAKDGKFYSTINTNSSYDIVLSPLTSISLKTDAKSCTSTGSPSSRIRSSISFSLTVPEPSWSRA